MKKDNPFRKFFTLLSVDFYKLFRSVSFYVIFGIYAGFSALLVLLSLAVNKLTEAIEGDMLIFGLDLTKANSLFGNNISYGNLGLFLVVLFAIVLCSEFRDKTIRNKLAQGYSRTVVYFSSLTFTYIITAMAVVLGSVIIAVLGIPILGWAHSAYAVRYFFYELFALVPLVALIHTLAFGSRSMGITLGVGLPVIMVLPSIMSILNMFVSESSAVEWMTRLFFTSLEGYVPLVLAGGMGEEFSHLALNASLTYLLWTALFIGLGCLSFIKKDVK